MRNSGFGIWISSTFAKCLLHPDDIVLISGSYYGLQKLINIYKIYGKVWDIKFNPLKSQVVAFGGQTAFGYHDNNSLGLPCKMSWLLFF